MVFFKVGPYPTDLRILKQQNVKVILCLITNEEMKKYNLLNYPRLAQQYGFTFYHVPIDRKINHGLLKPVSNFLLKQEGLVYVHSWKQQRANAFLNLLNKRTLLSTSISSM
jgi:protein tyrosine phosphatase (PTP) superfamily phosphohydrolase (DUF442 family)